MKTLNRKEFLELLDSDIKSKYGSARQFAKKINVSPQYISAVLNGVKPPSAFILSLFDAKRERITVYHVQEKKQCTCPSCEHDFEALPVPDGEFITCPLCKSKLTPNGQGDL